MMLGRGGLRCQSLVTGVVGALSAFSDPDVVLNSRLDEQLFVCLHRLGHHSSGSLNSPDLVVQPGAVTCLVSQLVIVIL